MDMDGVFLGPKQGHLTPNKMVTGHCIKKQNYKERYTLQERTFPATLHHIFLYQLFLANLSVWRWFSAPTGANLKIVIKIVIKNRWY